jgi:hypothetical protein
MQSRYCQDLSGVYGLDFWSKLMAKKNKRQARKGNDPTMEKSSPDHLAGGRPTGFNPDYHFVISDIRRVGILAGSFIFILIVLSFFLH